MPLLDYGARFYNPTLARWTTPDPLSEKYYSISPYAFCGNNPVKYLDPDGKRLFFASGVSDKFKQQFAATVQFMNSKGTAGYLARIESSKTIYYITEAESLSGMHFNIGLRIISWDPNHIMVTTNNLWLSPATALAHEVGHAARYDEVVNSNDTNLVNEYKSDIRTGSDKRFNKTEERRVITTIEQETAIKHGEIERDQVTRTDHKGKQIGGSVGHLRPEEIQRIIYEHNQLLK